MGSQLSLLVRGATEWQIDQFWLRNGFFELAGHVVNYVDSSSKTMSYLGNQYLDGDSGCDVFGMCHADTTFSLEALGTFRDTAAAGRVCGMVGRDLNGNYVWSKDFHCRFVPVSTLDCCSVFFRRDSGLRFDEETFDGFHCYVEDLCLQAHAKGIPVVVPPAKASHLEESTRNPEWQADYKIYRKRLADKWAGTVFTTT